MDSILLGMSGLRGWWGKDFYGDGYAVNVKLHKGQVIRLFPMAFFEQTSYLNAQPGLALNRIISGLPKCLVAPFAQPHIYRMSGLSKPQLIWGFVKVTLQSRIDSLKNDPRGRRARDARASFSMPAGR